MKASQQPRWFLSTASASTGERVAAIIIISVAFLAFVATVPYVRVPLARVPAFIPAYQASLFVIDLMTAVLLLGQFLRLRSTALLALAAGYLFDSGMIFAHTLSFPGVFAPTGLLGAGEQTTAWLYVFWHGGFSLSVLAYAWLRNQRIEASPASVAGLVVFTIVLVLATVVALTALTTVGHDLMPRVMNGGDYSMLVSKGISPALWFVTLVAVAAVLWRGRTVLDMWLTVVMTVWLFDIALAAVFGSSRFDLGFYAGRIYGLIAACTVLIALLIEIVRFYGSLADALDLSELRNMELVRSRDALAAAQRMDAIGQITGGIAHDFNNLLTVLGGNLELIRKDPADAARVERLATNAEMAVKRAARLTRQLLTFGGRQASRPVITDVSRLIQGFEPVLQRAAEGAELMTGLLPTIHPISIDPRQFETAFINLIVNAREATAGNGRIILETSNVVLRLNQFGDSQSPPSGDYVLVTVRDTGPGMTAEVAARAFEPFFTTKPAGKGSGLGLSQVYGFVRSAGGHVQLESQPGRGTSVRMYFPKAAKAATVESKPDGATVSLPSRGSETVLVVEDDPDVREVTTAAVVDIGYAVREAANAEEALTLLRSDAGIDLLFSDIVMPGGMTGIELAAAARRVRPNLKVLLTSGNAGALMSNGTIADGDFDVIEKPYPHKDLETRLRSIMGRG